MAAIELIHKQPVRWTKSRVVSCDGGGGPLGHPKVFINTDKAEIATCGYCGLPFVSALPHTAWYSEQLTNRPIYRLTSSTAPTLSPSPLPATPSSLPTTPPR